MDVTGVTFMELVSLVRDRLEWKLIASHSKPSTSGGADPCGSVPD